MPRKSSVSRSRQSITVTDKELVSITAATYVRSPLGPAFFALSPVLTKFAQLYSLYRFEHLKVTLAPTGVQTSAAYVSSAVDTASASHVDIYRHPYSEYQMNQSNVYRSFTVPKSMLVGVSNQKFWVTATSAVVPDPSVETVQGTLLLGTSTGGTGQFMVEYTVVFADLRDITDLPFLADPNKIPPSIIAAAPLSTIEGSGSNKGCHCKDCGPRGCLTTGCSH